MNVLVTGGAGFIGSHIVDALLARGDRVRVLDNLSTGRRSNLAAARGSDRLEFIEGDILDEVTINAACRGIEIVFHEAARSSVPFSVAHPDVSIDNNVRGTLNVLRAAEAAGVARFVYAASSSAYGLSVVLPKVETMIPAPISPYAVAKLAGEHLCEAWTHCYGLSTVSLRYFNVYGPRQRADSAYSPVVPRFIDALRHGRAPTIYGDGRQSRDFTYVADVVRANLAAAAAAAGGVYNVGAGCNRSLLDVLAAVETAVDAHVEPTFEPPRVGDVLRTLADTTAISAAFGWKAEVDLVEGVRRTVEGTP